jgi:hypothetical protein
MFCQLPLIYYICPSILRGGAVVARWAHNPKVGGSNPPSATKKKPGAKEPGFFVLQPEESLLSEGMKTKKPLPCGTHGWLFLWVVTPEDQAERSEV